MLLRGFPCAQQQPVMCAPPSLQQPWLEQQQERHQRSWEWRQVAEHSGHWHGQGQGGCKGEDGQQQLQLQQQQQQQQQQWRREPLQQEQQPQQWQQRRHAWEALEQEQRLLLDLLGPDAAERLSPPPHPQQPPAAQAGLEGWAARQTAGLRRLQEAPAGLVDGVRLLYLNFLGYAVKVHTTHGSRAAMARDPAARMLAEDLNSCINQFFLLHPALRPQLLCVNLRDGRHDPPPLRHWEVVAAEAGALECARADAALGLELRALASILGERMALLRSRQAEVQLRLAATLHHEPPCPTGLPRAQAVQEGGKLLRELEGVLMAQHNLETAVLLEVHKLFPPEMLVHLIAAAAPWWPDTAAILRIVVEELDG